MTEKMNFGKMVANRQKANFEIAELLKNTDLDLKYGIAAEFKELAEQLPEQRAGQIITNYICGDYRSGASKRTKEILDELFPGNEDPFFEESVVTLRRIQNALNS